MNIKQIALLLFLFLVVKHGFCQVSEETLESAVQTQQCKKIGVELDKTPLLTEEMKFNGAICFYRNGNIERAMLLFQEVKQIGGQRQYFASFWEAKCHASLHQDSMAMASLQAIPAGILNHKMLSNEVFENIAKENEAFLQLKQSVEPGFNIWTGLLSVAALLGLLIGFLLIFGKSRFSAGEKWLSLVVFSFTIILISYVLIWTGYALDFPYLQNVWQFLTFLIGPSLYFYLKDSFKEEYTPKQIVMHYALPMLSGLLSIPRILLDFGIQTGMFNDLFVIGSSSILLTCHLLFYAVLIYSMTENEWQVDANISVWTRMVAWGMIVYTFAFISYFVLVRCSFFNPEWDYAISLVMALSILVIAYMGLAQKRIFSSEPIGNFLPVKKYQTSNLTQNASESIRLRMERLLTEERVFKENELRLADLAAYLDINRHQLSQVINEHYGVNFFELINKYRVEYVKKLLEDPKYSHLTIIQIAYEAGFNNKASFNRCFKKDMEMTPSAYRIKQNSEV